MIRQLGVLLGAFFGGALLAGILGADSFGIALSVGQLCFATALVWALLA
jgi:hypothetical protein